MGRGTRRSGLWVPAYDVMAPWCCLQPGPLALEPQELVINRGEDEIETEIKKRLSFNQEVKLLSFQTLLWTPQVKGSHDLRSDPHI